MTVDARYVSNVYSFLGIVLVLLFCQVAHAKDKELTTAETNAKENQILLNWRVVNVGRRDSGGYRVEGSSISGNGKWVAFVSDADNLVPGDTNRQADVFVLNLDTGFIRRVSLSSQGEQANGRSSQPSISHDGRYIAFRSLASNLISRDLNQTADVFLRDVKLGITKIVSLTSLSEQIDGPSALPDVSSDGKRVAFQNKAPGIVSGDLNPSTDVFVRDLALAKTFGVPRIGGTGASSAANTTNEQSSRATLSSNGKLVAFQSASPNFVAHDTNRCSDIFLWSIDKGLVQRVSEKATRGGDHESLNPSFSENGRFLVFQSAATNLSSTDTNSTFQIYKFDTVVSKLTLVSADANGSAGNEPSIDPVVANDGTVVFKSFASNFGGNEQPNTLRLYHVTDMGLLQQVGRDADFLSVDGNVESADISASGKKIIFEGKSLFPASGNSSESSGLFLVQNHI